jgi:pyruvate/2-oxoglutarate dehydrogenase complex dihydrolipoamide dehydrogenase (E3) component
VDAHGKPVPGTEEFYSCDTLLLSCGLIPENELSAKAGVTLSPLHKGPEVNESLETNVPGIFACGNVLHVHDLVDFVSEEAACAGRNAAAYVKEKGKKTRDGEIAVKAGFGISYTVPERICAGRMEDAQTVRFRVNNVYRDHYISVYLGDRRVTHKKKQIAAPGEMEQIILKKSDLAEEQGLSEIRICLEEA